MLSVVVPATDSPPTLARCLAALAAAADGSDEVLVIREPAGSGFAAARRKGASAAQGDLIAFVDSDVLVHHDALTRLRAAFVEDPHLAAVFGSYDDSPEAPDVVSRFRNLLHHYVHQSSPGGIGSFWGGLGAVRREAFEAVGGFDPAEKWLDDVDLGMRLTAAGFRVELRPDIQGMHLKHWTLASMVWTDFARRGVPWVELLLRHRATPPRQLNLAWRHRATAVATVLAVLALGARRPQAVLAALTAIVVLNGRFYALLVRREGPARAAAGVGLHAIHHLASTAAIVVGGAVYALRRSRARLDPESTFER